MKNIILALALLSTPVMADPYLYQIPVDGSPLQGVQVRPDKKDTVVVINNHGGLIGEFMKQKTAWDETAVHVEIKGECASACTVYTGIEGACIHPGAFLKFHQAGVVNGDHDGADLATGMVLDMMKPIFRDYIMYHVSKFPTLESGTYLVLNADEIIANHWMPQCKPLPKNFKQLFNSNTYIY